MKIGFHYREEIRAVSPALEQEFDRLIIPLQRFAQPGTALTAANAGTLNTGDATSDTVITNMRTRIAQLEALLQSKGLLP